MMSARTATLAFAFACGLLLPGCAGAPDAPIVPATTAVTAVDLDAFPGAARLLEGFDAATAQADWLSGDRALLALQLRKGQDVHRWLLHLEVMIGDVMHFRLADDTETPIRFSSSRTWDYWTTVDGERRQHTIASRMQLVVVRVHDEHGTQLGKSTVNLPADLLDAGLLPGIDAARAVYAEAPTASTPLATDEQQQAVRQMVQSTLALVAMLSIVQEDNVLADYFWQVVEKPSIWSVLTSFGVRASLVTALEQSLPASALPANLPDLGPAFVVPMRVEVNGSPALLADIVATASQRPFALCGGIVAATARHPSRPELQFDVQLLAAKLGTAPAKNTVKNEAK